VKDRVVIETRWLSSSYGDKQDLLKGGKGERVRGKGVLIIRSILLHLDITIISAHNSHTINDT
jgi:hypothetical protein